MSIKIALCIPTYNHKEMIEELLNERFLDYQKYGIDLFIYDSSDNDQTKTLLSTYKHVCYENCVDKVKDRPFNMHSNLKAYYALKELSVNNDYDYIWLYGDSIRYSNKALSRIITECDRNEFDFIVMGRSEAVTGETESYKEPCSFYRKYGWWMTGMGHTIVRRKTVLENVDWKYYENRYINDLTVNFSHLCLYIERGINIRDFSALFIKLDSDDSYNSVYKSRSVWFKKGLEIWFDYWPAAINSLPETVKFKEEIIDSFYNNARSISKKDLLPLRAYGKLTEEFSKQHKIRFCKLVKITENELQKVLDISINDAVYTIEQKKGEFMSFCNGHKRLIVYGAGVVAKKKSYILDRLGIEYDCFVVTNTNDTVSYYRNHRVMNFEQYGYKHGQTGIIMALGRKNSEEVIKTTLSKVSNDDIYNEEMDDLLI